MKAMNCKNFRISILDALSDEIGGDRRAAFERHLETCGACKKEYAELKEIFEFLDVPETKSVNVIPIDVYCKPEKPAIRGNWMRAALFFAVFLSAVTICTQFRRISDSFENIVSKRAVVVATGEKTAGNKRLGNQGEKTSEATKIAIKNDPYDGETDSMLGSCYTNPQER